MRDPRFRQLAVLGLLLALLDQVVKWSVVWYFDDVEGSRIKVIDGFFDLILTRNPGAAFSMLANLEPDWLRVLLFVALSVVAIIFIFHYASKASATQRLFLCGLGFVLGGAVGNLIDRVYAGRVVDYLEFYSRVPWLVELLGCRKSWGCRFPAFNVADIAINVGVGLLILDSILSALRPEVVAPPAPAGEPPSSAVDVSAPASAESAAAPGAVPAADAPPSSNGESA